MSKESMDHKVVVTKVANPKFPLTVRCTCAWQAHARNENEANVHKRRHEMMAQWLKASKGFQVGHA